jgi:hypothetical protein
VTVRDLVNELGVLVQCGDLSMDSEILVQDFDSNFLPDFVMKASGGNLMIGMWFHEDVAPEVDE